MLFMKNLPAWERGLRVGAGVVISGLGLYFFPGSLTGYGIGASARCGRSLRYRAGWWQ